MLLLLLLLATRASVVTHDRIRPAPESSAISAEAITISQLINQSINQPIDDE